MSKSIVEVEGFEQLRAKLKKLGANDSKRRQEMLKVLRQSAKGTLKAARDEAPISKKEHIISGSRSRRVIQPGNLRKSIGNITGKSKTVPTIYVGPRVKGKNLGFYGAFVHGGTKTQSPNKYMDRAFSRTSGRVTVETEKNVANYIQRQIDKLSNA